MNNLQLYLTIGIPSFMVILAWLTGWANSNRLSDKIDRTDAKADRTAETLTAKMDKLAEMQNAKMDKLAEMLNAKLDRMIEQQHKDAMALQGYMIPLHERMAKLEAGN